ncbi:type II toxin-antitoxin system RelE/ParE family toxin [Sphaerospermopsis torques-reginae]
MYKFNQFILLGSTPPTFAKATEQTFQTTHSIATESTFQPADSTTFLENRIQKNMTYPVEYINEFGEWYEELDEGTQDSIDAVVELLEERGPNLGAPYSSAINGSRHQHMRELRIQHKGQPYRILYAFDPRRTAILLLGGNKTGNDRWYVENIRKADKLYDEYIQELEDEGLI